MSRVTHYPRPHNNRVRYAHSLEVANQASTIIPIAFYDEGKGAPSGYNSNPKHASFLETDEANCYPDSQLTNITTKLEFHLTKGALETDKLHTVKIAFMPIFLSFKEDQEANDELSGLDIGEILEMQKESTDRQSYPLWNATDITGQWSGSEDLPAATPGLTAGNTKAVDFSAETYYDALQYYTNGGKLKTVQGGLNWVTLTKQRPHKTIHLKFRSKIKYMNPYTFFGVMTHCPQVDTFDQIPLGADTTAIGHIGVNITYRYNEWNEYFDHEAGAQ